MRSWCVVSQTRSSWQDLYTLIHILAMVRLTLSEKIASFISICIPQTDEISRGGDGGILESADGLWIVCRMGFSVGEMLCPKQFSSNLNYTCYIWPLWCLDVHNIICVRPGQRVVELCPFYRFFLIHIIFSCDKEGVYSSLHSWVL